ncbi:HEXXH motif domain-containing protein [Solihabitans fulvus]|uniref:HEXXH motif domain-containing protein n=1 Tax=Solihabitans fulvus TaxID=1892852 RepID=UPI001661E1B7|nr:HEXXH motif domain-containing protein [Solihabitans fulvus]
MAPSDSSADQEDTLPHHRLDEFQLDALALGEHDDRALEVLRNAEYSRRLLMLRLLLRLARRRLGSTGPLSPVDVAWRLLASAADRAPDAVSQMLTHPQTGVWAAHTLRRLRHSTSDPAPLWFHVGQLHSFASAAAIRAGLRFRLTVPLWDGIAVLPTLGAAQVSTVEPWTSAVVISDDAGARVAAGAATVAIPRERDESGDPSWQPARVLRAAGRGGAPSLVVHLDDLGPYRGLDSPTPPDPLPPDSAARWSALLDDAWHLLTRDHLPRAAELSAGLVAVTPAPATFRFRPFSASVGDGFGGTIVSESLDAAQLAVTLVHEFQHSKLTGVDHLVALQHEDDAEDCYAPWRDDPRFTSGLLQGIYAFTAVTEFWGVQRGRVTDTEHELAEFEFALRRRQANLALMVLRHRTSLTEAGRRFVDRIARRLAPWQTAIVTADALRAANTATEDHLAGWRVSHLRPTDRLVRQAVQAWLAGDPSPAFDAPSAVVPNPNPPRLDTKAVLAQVLMADRAEFARARAQLGRSTQARDNRGAGDFSLVTGDSAGARELYLAELAHPCDRPGAWSGLGLALESVSPGRAATTLRTRPELVSTIHDAVAAATGEAPHPERLAGWLGGDL